MNTREYTQFTTKAGDAVSVIHAGNNTRVTHLTVDQDIALKLSALPFDVYEVKDIATTINTICGKTINHGLVQDVTTYNSDICVSCSRKINSEIVVK